MHRAHKSEEEVVPGGRDLIENWLQAQEGLARAKRAVNGAECAEANAHSALAKWLKPDDMRPGEKVAVWMGDSLFQVEIPLIGDGTALNPKVTVRTRGHKFHELRR